ncbi:MAG TPA: MarR family transcriptional regulator [Baekduia sp.]
MSSRTTKQTKIDALVNAFRVSGNLDRAFDALAAQELGVNQTDLHCLNIVESRGGVTAGALATEAGLTTGAITGVIDRLERAGYVRRERDAEDRRRVAIVVTPEFYAAAGGIWGPVKEDWDTTLAARFTGAELDVVTAFLAATEELTRRHLARLGQAQA